MKKFIIVIIMLLFIVKSSCIASEINDLRAKTENKAGGQSGLAQKCKNQSTVRDDVDFGPYMRKLQRKIKKNWYPVRSKTSKHVVIFFKIDKAGNLNQMKVLKSSGNKDVDDAAISATEKSAPFKPLPSEFKGTSISIQFTFDYNVYNNIAVSETEIKDDTTAIADIKQSKETNNIDSTQIKILNNTTKTNITASSVEKDVDFGPYMRKLQKNIRKNWTPSTGKKSKEVIVFFTIDKLGNLQRIKIDKTSGDKFLDESAISAVVKTIPFQPLPFQFKGKSINIQFAFDYKANENNNDNENDLESINF